MARKRRSFLGSVPTAVKREAASKRGHGTGGGKTGAAAPDAECAGSGRLFTLPRH